MSMTRGKLKMILFCLVIFTAMTASLRVWADRADTLYKEGLDLEGKGSRDFAVFKYLAIVRDYPRSKWADAALFKIAEFYYENRDYFNAKENFEGLVRSYPESNFVKMSRQYLESIAEIYGKTGSEGAIKKIISGIENLKNEQKWDEALGECDKLSALSPLPDEYKTRLAEYYKACGDAYVKDEAWGKAKIAYEKVMKITPDDAEALNQLYEINKLLKKRYKLRKLR